MKSKNNTKAKVIVLGCGHAGLSIIRSLGKRGIYVVGVTHDKTEFGLFSRYLKETAICPHPEDKEAFADFLLKRVDTWSNSLLLETTDHYMLALSRHKVELSEHYRMIAPDPEIASVFIEKDKTYALADSVNVPHPNFFKPKNQEEFNMIADQILLPVMIKPVISHEFGQIFNMNLFICETFDEFRNNFQRTLEASQPVIITEIIPGTDYGTMEKVMLYINTKGDISAEFFNIKLRQSPPMFGRMRVGKSTSVNQEVLDLTRRLLGKINFRGYASVEFKRDYRDNKLKLMEVNIRQPLGSHLPIASGVDFPWIIYQDLIMDKQVRIDHYHDNTYLIDLNDDVINFIRLDPSRNIIQFLRPYFGRKAFMILNWKDIKPYMKSIQILWSRFVNKISASKGNFH